MSTTSHSFGSTVTRRPSETITLTSNPIAALSEDGRLVDFELTRFRTHALKLQQSLEPTAQELASLLEVKLTSLSDLNAEPEKKLQSATYCVFDFLDVKSRRVSGFLRTRWLPLTVFIGGERVFSLHASYKNSSCRLVGLTLATDGKEEYTRCFTEASALKVGRAFLRNYSGLK